MPFLEYLILQVIKIHSIKSHNTSNGGKNRMIPKVMHYCWFGKGVMSQNRLEQKVGAAVIYPPSIFNSYDNATGKLNKINKIIYLFWYVANWLSKEQKIRGMKTKPLHRIIEVDAVKRFRK